MTELPPLRQVGVTASRHGLTTMQIIALRIALLDLKQRRDAEALHHGDCVGGDETAAQEARRLGLRVVAHPPVVARLRAHFPSDEERAPLGYLQRDRNIVDEADVLLGFPATDVPVAHSGTWFTIGYAVAKGRPRLVVGRSGRILQSVGVEGLWQQMPAGVENFTGGGAA